MSSANPGAGGPSDAVTQRFLQSIVKVTEHQDCRRFRASLAETIGEFVLLRELVFARPQRHDSGAGYQILHSEVPRFTPEPRPERMAAEIEAILSAQNVSDMMVAGELLIPAADSTTLLLPVVYSGSLMEIVVLRVSALPQSARDVIKALVRLYRNFMALIHESETDPLTGLYNRRTLEVSLRAVVREANDLSRNHRRSDGADQRHGGARQSAFLAVIDIDRFKRINDTLGHVFGDEVIILVARLMREMFRDEDALFRYGGEEFVVVLLAENLAGAQAALERFRTQVAAHRFPQLDQVTVSIGFVEIRDNDVVSGVVGKADKALYHSKTTGRNRTTAYADLLAAGTVVEAEVYGDVDLF